MLYNPTLAASKFREILQIDYLPIRACYVVVPSTMIYPPCSLNPRVKTLVGQRNLSLSCIRQLTRSEIC
jgi:hypothetical protein